MKKEKVLFAYNGRVDIDDSGNFYGNELNDILVNRYRFLGNHVSFLVRSRRIEQRDTTKVLPFKSKNFTIIPTPDFNAPIKFILNIQRIKQIIRSAVADTDILVARLPSTIGRIAITYAIKYNKPYLVEVVGCPWDALWNHSWMGKFVAPYAYLQMKKFVAKAPYVIYVTKFFLQHRYPCSHFTAGISDVILESSDELVLRDRLKKIRDNTGKMKFTLGTVAAFDVKYKGQDTVIRAMPKLKSAGLDINYRLVGKGTGNYLRELASSLGVLDQIEFVGQIPHNDIFTFLDSLDIYIQPSKQEGLPRAMVEAMSRACPCIGTQVGGIPELIEKNMIYEKDNVRDLVRVILELDENVLVLSSGSNFEKSTTFLTSQLDSNRERFYLKFLNDIA